ncbi:DUF6913 domain-containing protein [Algivirga pacifica]|uniref:SseB protein N-terminal domain-containing protein n=1 Tax=Algivirga pacifica TaxID=1162670 RepID=A0ABP9DM32_9BACT
MNNVKEFFVKRKLNEAINSSKHFDRKSTTFTESKRIGILFGISTKEEADVIRQLIHQLTEEKKDVQAFTYFGKKELNLYNFPFEYMTEDEMDWQGGMQSEKAFKFINQPFDYLLYLSSKDSLPLKFLLASSRAYCRVGAVQEGDKDLLELMIGVPSSEGISVLSEEMLSYLKKINS